MRFSALLGLIYDCLGCDDVAEVSGCQATHKYGSMSSSIHRTEQSPNSTLQPSRMFRPHLVGVADRIVRGMDDHLRPVVRVRPAVDADQVAAAIAVGGKRRLGTAHAEGRNADPRLVAEERAVLADEHRLGKSIR